MSEKTDLLPLKTKVVLVFPLTECGYYLSEADVAYVIAFEIRIILQQLDDNFARFYELDKFLPFLTDEEQEAHAMHLRLVQADANAFAAALMERLSYCGISPK